MVMEFGYGLEPKSKKAYRDEWNLYLRFCQRSSIRRVPGRDVRWSFAVVRDYLQWRSRRVNVRTLHGIKSKLKHGGLCWGYVLPNAKGEEPAALRLQLALVHRAIGKRQARECKAAGTTTDPKRSLALGRVAIGLLFSAYGATTRAGFRKLDVATRHWLVICVAMHTGCMRFKLLKKLCKADALRWSQADQTYRLASDWRKMKRGGAFTVPFPLRPAFRAMRYSGYSRRGKRTDAFTAAHVLRWHVEERGSMRGNLFAPMGNVKVSRRSFQVWLRESFGRLLVGKKQEMAALVASITPHSFRAGMASDLERDQVPRLHIKKVGRWQSDRAMEQYARDGLAQRLRKLTFRSLQQCQLEINGLAFDARPGKRARSSDDHFGSSSEGGVLA